MSDEINGVCKTEKNTNEEKYIPEKSSSSKAKKRTRWDSKSRSNSESQNFFHIKRRALNQKNSPTNSKSRSQSRLHIKKSPKNRPNPIFQHNKNRNHRNSFQVVEKPRYQTRQKAVNTIFLSSVPRIHLNFTAIEKFFSPFGEILDIQIIPKSRQCFIQYEMHSSALNAMEKGFPAFGLDSIVMRWAYFDKRSALETQNFYHFMCFLGDCQTKLQTLYFRLNQQKSPLNDDREEIEAKIKNFCLHFPSKIDDVKEGNFSVGEFFARNYAKKDVDKNLELVKIKRDSEIYLKELKEKRKNMEKEKTVIKVSNLPEDCLNDEFVTSRFFKYGFVQESFFLGKDLYLRYLKEEMAEKALKEKMLQGNLNVELLEKKVVEEIKKQIIKHKESNLAEKRSSSRESSEESVQDDRKEAESNFEKLREERFKEKAVDE